MRVDVRVDGDLHTVRGQAAAAESAGCDAVWAAEAGNDPFFPLLVAAEHTQHVQIGTAIAVAFARSPMTLAQTAWDLNHFSRGRFLLGLGSQIKAHIEKRYSMPWSRPAARMREMICAMRAIWDCWQHGSRLDFQGEFYTHTLMTPVFCPDPNQWGPPKVFLAGVGAMMTRVAGEVADGLRIHSFTTERYVREVTLPAVDAGLTASGRSRGTFELSYPPLIATGDTPAQLEQSVAGIRKRIAFYGSTPAYRPVLELHGWGDLQSDLSQLSKRGAWEEMGRLIDDDVLHAFAIVGTPEAVAASLSDRYGDVVDRLSLYLTDREWQPDGVATRIMAGLKP